MGLVWVGLLYCPGMLILYPGSVTLYTFLVLPSNNLILANNENILLAPASSSQPTAVRFNATVQLVVGSPGKRMDEIQFLAIAGCFRPLHSHKLHVCENL